MLSLLAMLGLWFEAAGPVGRGFDWVLRGAIGVAAPAFPVIALYWGVLLLRGTAEEDRLRMFIGFAIAGVGVARVALALARQPPPVRWLRQGVGRGRGRRGPGVAGRSASS